MDLLEREPGHVEALQTDYDRSITKSHWEMLQKKIGNSPQLGEQTKQSTPPLKVFPSRKTIPQLEEQEKQSTSPLKVASTILEIPNRMMKFAVESGLDLEQMFGQGDIPSAKLAWKYVHRQPLVPPEQMQYLQTWMRQLHDWYTQEAAGGGER
jgi:hypothetical protein